MGKGIKVGTASSGETTNPIAWKLLGSVTGNTPIDLPTEEYSELLVHVRMNSAGQTDGPTGTMVIPVEMVNTEETQGGFCTSYSYPRSNNDNANLRNAWVKTTESTIYIYIALGGSQVNNTSSSVDLTEYTVLTVWYR